MPGSYVFTCRMDEKPKKVHFSEEEKLYLRSLVIKYAKIVENKKSDVVALAEKKKTWDKIAEEFNNVPNHLKRSTNQLKKAWENIKFRRKAEIAVNRREKLKSGIGSYELSLKHDPELEPLEVYPEVDGAVDSDEIAMSTSYPLVETMLVPPEEEKPPTEIKEEEIEANEEASTSGDMKLDVPITVQEGVAQNSGKNLKEHFLRIQKNVQLMEHDQELHQLKKQEMRLKIISIEEQISQKRILFELKKKKLECEIRNLEER